jgi:putative copper export protein
VAPAAATFARRLRVAIMVAAGLGAASAAVAFAAYAANAAGTGGALTHDRQILVEAAGTRAGTGWVISLVAWAPVAAAAAVAARPVLLVLTAPGLAIASAGPALTGHAGEQGAAMVANVVHVLTASAWVGGLVALLALCRPRAWRADGDPSARLLAVAAGRFSTLALVCAIAIVATGIAQAVLILPAPADLVDSAYGRLVCLKAACLAGIVAAGARHRRHNLPALRTRADTGSGAIVTGAPLRAALRAEIALVAIVFSATGFMAGLSPAGGG